MTVEIEEFKSALAVENILTPYKKGRLSDDKKTRLPKEPITPQVCMKVLQSTNYARNIKDMLQCILELPVAEQGKFADVVCELVSQREQPKDILDMAAKLANDGGYDFEFDLSAEVAVGDFYPSSPVFKKYVATYKVDFDGKNFFGDSDENGVQKPYEGLIFLERHAPLILQQASNFPLMLDASRCERGVFAYEADFAGVERFILGKHQEVYLANTKNLPEQLDFSGCQKLNLLDADFNRTKLVVFKNQEQMIQSHFSQSANWSGQVVFADEGREDVLAGGVVMNAAKLRGGR